MSEEDNRKRVHQQDENDAANSSKRAAIVQGGAQEAGNGEEPEPFYFKLLCPQGITGLIIGKGGANIIQLNATTGARIKLSQNNEYFPNTTDRILLISGGKQGMENAIRELVSRIVEAPEKRQAPGEFLKQQTAPRPSGTYTIRVLIPKIASAAVIGKGGVVIKRMSEQSGCRFQLGEENDPFNTNERIVTITGTTSPSVVTGAIHIMFQLLDEAPRIRTYTNPTTNYSGRSGAPHQGVPQNIPHHMMGGQPPAAMMAPPGFVPYGAVPSPYVLQYSHMGQIQVPMQQAMFPQGMAPQSGFPMQAAQFPMGGAPPGGFVAAPAPMYAQYPPGQPVMDMSHAYQQQHQQQQQQQHPHQHQQQHFGAKPIYASPGPQGGMPIHQQIPQQQILHQHQPAQLGNHYGGGGSIHNGGKMK